MANCCGSNKSENKAEGKWNAQFAPITVMVAGGTSQVGSATIDYLLRSHPNVTVRAGVRDQKKATDRFGNVDTKRLMFFTHNVRDNLLTGDKTTDENELKGCDCLYLVPPQQFQDRLGHANAYLNAAKAAHVKHIVLLSAPAADNQKLILGKGLYDIERLVKGASIPYTILRSVMFWENHLGNAQTIKQQGAFYFPCKNDIPIPGIAVNDIGEAAANIIAQGPAAHNNRVYTIAGQSLSWDASAATFTKVLGKPVKFVPVADQDAIAAMQKMGYPESMSKGLVELHHDFERGTPYPSTELTPILGREPESFEHWVQGHSASFK